MVQRSYQVKVDDNKLKRGFLCKKYGQSSSKNLYFGPPLLSWLNQPLWKYSSVLIPWVESTIATIKHRKPKRSAMIPPSCFDWPDNLDWVAIAVVVVIRPHYPLIIVAANMNPINDCTVSRTTLSTLSLLYWSKNNAVSVLWIKNSSSTTTGWYLNNAGPDKLL